MSDALEKLANQIKVSGHNLHMRVAQKLRNKDFEVFVSPTYRDDPTSVVREVDILAVLKGKTPIPIALCIECKYLSEPVAFYQDSVDPVELGEVMTAQFHESDVGIGMLSSSEKFLDLRQNKERVTRICVPDRQVSEGNFQCIKAVSFFRERKKMYYYNWLIVDGNIYWYETDDFGKDKDIQTIRSELKSTDHLFFIFNYSGDNKLVEIFREDYFDQRIQELKEKDVAQINMTINHRMKK